MSSDSRKSYSFGDYTLDLGRACLFRDRHEVKLRPKSFEVLKFLVENRGRLVTKEELIQAVWPGTSVTGNSVFQCLKEVRRALRDTDQQIIKTVARRGYIFDAKVVEKTPTAPNEVEPEPIESKAAEERPSDSSLLRHSKDLAITREARPGENGGVRLGGSKGDLNNLGELLREIDGFPIALKSDLGVRECAIPPAVKPEPAIGHTVPISEPATTVRARDASATSSRSTRQGGRKTAAIAFAGLLIIGAAAVAFYGFIGRGWFRGEPTGPAANMTITSLTTAGNISCAAVSPDGKYVVYGVNDKPHLSSLWVMQPATSTSRELIPPAEVQYHALTVSPDGSYVYFVRWDNETGRTLYRVSLLGGASVKLMDNVETAVSFSPDGTQLVFRRGNNERREAALIVANVDGTEEKEVAASRYPDSFGDPAWSPDGKMIACPAGHAEGGINMYVVGVSVGDWIVKPISAQRWRWVGQMGWLADSSGLVMLASEHPTAPYQVWRLSYPDGQARRITNDSNFYNRLSVSADSRALVALQSRRVSNVWIIPREDARRARQITFGAGGYRSGLSWTPDGKIVYDSEAGSATAISIMDANGGNPKQLLGDMTGRAIVWYASASPDGRYILYASDLTGSRHIWRMNIDGSDPIQLTDGEGEDHPACSPDGRWVVYTKHETKSSGPPTLWRVSIDGGEPVQLTDAYTFNPSVSPDGKLIACFYSEVGTNQPTRIALYPFEGGQPIKIYPAPVGGWPYLRWTPDGRGLTYAENPIGAAKLWIQPVDGSPPNELAQFETDRIFGFDWSPDGSQLACVRGLWASNAVLIRNFR